MLQNPSFKIFFALEHFPQPQQILGVCNEIFTTKETYSLR